MVADRPSLASRPRGDLKTIAGHVDANENLSRHESSALAKSPALAQPCRMRTRRAAQATVRALGRTRLGRPSFPTDSVDQRSKRPVPVSDLVLSACADDTTKIQGARSEPASAAATGGGGPQAPPT